MKKYVTRPEYVEAGVITSVAKTIKHSPYLQYVVTEITVEGNTEPVTFNYDITAQIGDYYVKQEDEYTYISPKSVFERIHCDLVR